MKELWICEKYNKKVIAHNQKEAKIKLMCDECEFNAFCLPIRQCQFIETELTGSIVLGKVINGKSLVLQKNDDIVIY